MLRQYLAKCKSPEEAIGHIEKADNNVGKLQFRLSRGSVETVVDLNVWLSTR